MLDIDGCIQISMCLIVADLTAKRLLIRSVGSIYIMTDAAFLGGVGALDSRCSYPPLGRIPGDLFWDVCEIRSTHIGIHVATQKGRTHAKRLPSLNAERGSHLTCRNT